MIDLLVMLGAVGMAAPPVPVMSFADLFAGADYPRHALIEEQQGVTRYRLSISAKGETLRCDIASSSGFEALDKETCRAAGRAIFKPALDESGQPVAAVYRGRFAWHVPDGPPLADPPSFDTALTVKQLPAGLPDPAYVTVNLLVGANGAIEACWGARRSAKAAPVPDEVIEAGCAQAASGLKMPPVIAANGEKLRSMQTAVVTLRRE